MPTTSSSCALVSSGKIGSEMTALAAASASGKLPFAQSEVLEAGLKMERERIVDRRPDPLLLQEGLQLVAPLHPQRVLVEDRDVGRIDVRRLHFGQVGEGGVVVRRVGPAPRAPVRQVRQLGEQDRRLQRVQPRVVADFVVEVLLARRRAPEGA